MSPVPAEQPPTEAVEREWWRLTRAGRPGPWHQMMDTSTQPMAWCKAKLKGINLDTRTTPPEAVCGPCGRAVRRRPYDQGRVIRPSRHGRYRSEESR